MSGVPRPQLVLDCDPGHDDVLAIVTAAHFGDVLGITTVAGNAALEHTTRNALVTAQLAGIEAPVHAGAAGPLQGETRDAVSVHGETGLAGVELPAITSAVAGDDAPGFLVDTVRAHPGCWLVPVGPLTNIALALQRAPEVATLVTGISLMGGGTLGNATAAAEFNIWADPEAADVVFRSGANIRMCGLDLTHQVCVDEPYIAALCVLGTPLGDFVAGLLAHYRTRIMRARRRRPRGASRSVRGACRYPSGAVHVRTPTCHRRARRHLHPRDDGDRSTRHRSRYVRGGMGNRRERALVLVADAVAQCGQRASV